ncbi:MAG: GNAT family N-acetyltransferase [Oscillospiraceae bacterium]
MSGNIKIRPASVADTESLLAIYTPYVMETAVTFDYTVPSAAAFAAKMRKITEKYPFFVAEEDGQIVGYAYASAFKDRAAYNWTVETTIYLSQKSRGKGIGRTLYLALEDALKRQNVLNLNACIAVTTTEDAYLTNASVYFHEKLGYRKVAHFSACGFKFGRWYDMIWMEKLLGAHTNAPTQFVPFPQVQ